MGCECKDYSGSIPVDDVEEFKAKLDQIAGANKKGVMILSGALQRSALKYARANGIGIVRLMPDDQVRHLISNMSWKGWEAMQRRKPTEFAEALTQADYVATNRKFYAAWGTDRFDDWRSILKGSLHRPHTSC